MLKRIAHLLGVLVLIGFLLPLASLHRAEAATQLTLKPSADTYVDSSSPSTNYGTRTSLRVDASPLVRSYLRFDLAGLTGTVTQATLRVYANSASSSGVSVYPVANTTWSETGTVYTNAPAVGNLAATSSAVTAGAWKELNVTALIKPGGLVSLALGTPGSTAISLASREAGANAPQLVITLATPSATATPTRSPASPTSTPLRTATATPALSRTPTSPPSRTPTPALSATPTRIISPTSTSTRTTSPTATPARSATPTPPVDNQPGFPIRAAFYYPWFPEGWDQQGYDPFTNYHPTLGFYDSGSLSVIRNHLAAMQYGNIQAGIASWWGQGKPTDTRFGTLLSAAAGSSFRWAVYYEKESLGNPSVSELQGDLNYLRDHYGKDPSYLRVGGKFVVFVYSDGLDGCEMADRWKQANTVGAYIVLKVFAGYAACPSQPDSWHQYGPAVAEDSQAPYSFTISPGYWKMGETPGLARDPALWPANIRDMIASHADWQLITTFNEWGEGTSVESAQEWSSGSGYGLYLDALHTDGAAPLPSATPTTPASATPTPTRLPSTATPTQAVTPTPTRTPTPSGGGSTSITLKPVADAYVDASLPNNNYGTGTTLRVDGSPVVRAYLRFDLSAVSGTITRLTLRFYANSASSSGISAWKVANTTWSETGITAANAPAPGSTIATTGAVTAGAWKEVDLTGLAGPGSLASFGLSTAGGTAISLASRESGANSPQLVVVYQSSGGATSTPVPPTPTRTPTALPTPNPGDSPAVLLAVGDIAKCGGGLATPAPGSGAEITGNMLASAPGTLFTLGDSSNDSGAPEEYANCYDRNWGKLNPRLHPALGNHDQNYGDHQAAPFFDYFGTASHPDTYDHYSLDLGTWHIVVLNAQCGVGGQGCQAGSTQETWLRADLAAHPNQCTLAIWHQPLFTSGTQSAYTGMRPFWQALYDYNADVILNAHNHNYERFAPQDPNALADPARGIRAFVVGTGGASLDNSTFPLAANEEVRSAAAFGYLRLTLKPGSYDWQFVPQPGKTFTDSGSGVCH